MEHSTQHASPATTIVNSQPTSRVHSLEGNPKTGAANTNDKKGALEAQGAHPRNVGVEVEQGSRPVSKDRAPVFVVVLCLFQSLAGLLFGE